MQRPTLPPLKSKFEEYFVLSDFVNALNNFATNLRPNYQKNGFKKSSSSTLSYRMSWNMSKLCHKLQNTKKCRSNFNMVIWSLIYRCQYSLVWFHSSYCMFWYGYINGLNWWLRLNDRPLPWQSRDPYK